jgi:oligopeptide transport system substrate-binding protein
MKKLLAMLLALVMVLSLAACAGNEPAETPAEPSETTPSEPAEVAAPASYTYKSSTTALGSNWNPHTWETNGDSAVMGYIESPLCTMSILDSENGVYQWIMVAAESITDVTAENQGDLTKYAVNLPAGQTAEETEKGFVFEIKLNPDMKWQDGTPINADTYIYSMQQLLAPEMKNYRANLYYSGESAVAGGASYYNAGQTVYLDNADGTIAAIADLTKDENGVYVDANGAAVKIAVAKANEWLGGNSLADYVGAYGDAMFDVAAFEALSAAADDEGLADLTDETLANLVAVITFSADWGETADNAVGYLQYAKTYPEFSYDGVGCYKVDDYTIRYVTESQIDYNYFLTSCTSNWLVYEELYEAGKTTEGNLVTTNYGTSLETTMSYGPYKMESLQDAKQMVFVQNENYYLYQKQEDGSLYAETEYLVDGEHVQAYQTTRVVIDVMDPDAAKLAFLKGELSEWAPTADDLPTYSLSDQMYKAPETYTMSFFFNTDVDALKAMDEGMGNTNSVVLSNHSFRKAFSMGIDREEFVGATEGYIAAYSMLNELYYYDVYNDPSSSYRNTDVAKQAIVNFYGVEYGEGTPYADLDAAYDSINGYNLTVAQELMKQACEELVADGLYVAGDPIHIRIGWAKGALTSADNQQVTLMQKYINAAAEGSGFGPITLEGVGNIPSRYDAVPAGEYAVGYGAWGGAAFYPFRNFQVYCDPDQYGINEAGCWDPTTETLTLMVNGEEMTKTWQEWSGCMVGSGDLANESFETKLAILAAMEENYLNFVYRIPLCATTICSLLTYQADYYTQEYNIMYGYGGLELMTYNYTDAEWADFVASQGGNLSYE